MQGVYQKELRRDGKLVFKVLAYRASEGKEACNKLK
jgi:hypothetical protein